VVLTWLGVEGIRVKRTECRTVMEQYNNCAKRSYLAYQSAFVLGDDGRPDWLARKSCNYITTSLDVCPDHLRAGGCKSEEEVTTMKDALMEETLKQVKASVERWDSQKCPPVRAYMERLGLLPVETAELVSGEAEGGEGGEGSNCECFMESIFTQMDRLSRAWNAFAEVWNAM